MFITVRGICALRKINNLELPVGNTPQHVRGIDVAMMKAESDMYVLECRVDLPSLSIKKYKLTKLSETKLTHGVSRIGFAYSRTSMDAAELSKSKTPKS